MKRHRETGLECHSLEDSLSSGHICLLAHSCVSPAREFCASGPVVFVGVYYGGVIDQIAIRMTKLDLQPPSRGHQAATTWLRAPAP